MTRAQLFLLVMTALVLLVNLLARGLRRWVKGDVPRGMESEAPQIPPRGRRPPPPVVEPRRAREGPSTAPWRPAGPPDAAHRRPRSPLGGRRAVRRGIVLMTVLGPCRALEPPDSRGPCGREP
jgi:hypothetical protein